jgi:hypothetical protein
MYSVAPSGLRYDVLGQAKWRAVGLLVLSERHYSAVEQIGGIRRIK